MNYSKEQLVTALLDEWEKLCHDCPEDDDDTLEEREEWLNTLTIEQLIYETDTDDEIYPLDEYMENHL